MTSNNTMHNTELHQPSAPSPESKEQSALLSRMAMLAAVSALFSPVTPTKLFHHDYDDQSDIHNDQSLSLARVFGLSSSNEAELADLDVCDDEAFPFWSGLGCCGRASRKNQKPFLDDKNEWCLDVPLDTSKLKDLPVSVEDLVREIDANNFNPLVSLNSFNNPGIDALVESTRSGLIHSISPSSLSDGMGGVYVMYDTHSNPIAVFKPGDEEVGCHHNPKGYSPKENAIHARAGVLPGHAMYREALAFLLDHKGFVGVPETCLVSYASSNISTEAKVGSLQRYVASKGVAGDLGSSLFSVSDVQKIAMFDIRMLNIDRHDGNILVTDEYRLVPIDHGFCLPSRFEVANFEWCWYTWSQLKQETTPEIKAYIASLNPIHDISLIQSHNIPISASATRIFFTTTKFLQIATAANLTLFEIASHVSRDSEDTPSALERLMTRAKWTAAVQCVAAGEMCDFESFFQDCVVKALTSYVYELSSTV